MEAEKAPPEQSEVEPVVLAEVGPGVGQWRALQNRKELEWPGGPGHELEHVQAETLQEEENLHWLVPTEFGRLLR